MEKIDKGRYIFVDEKYVCNDCFKKEMVMFVGYVYCVYWVLLLYEVLIEKCLFMRMMIEIFSYILDRFVM